MKSKEKAKLIEEIIGEWEYLHSAFLEYVAGEDNSWRVERNYELLREQLRERLEKFL